MGWQWLVSIWEVKYVSEEMGYPFRRLHKAKLENIDSQIAFVTSSKEKVHFIVRCFWNISHVLLVVWKYGLY